MGENERLEPALNPDQCRIRSVHNLLHPKPDMSALGKSDVLAKVKNFLPVMAEADSELQMALKNGHADQLNIENIEGDDKVIEMDVALLKNGVDDEDKWTSDSEPDSAQSLTDNNDYTSDEDISSSSSCSSSSCSDKEEKKQRTSTSTAQKRPLIQEIGESSQQQPSKFSRSNDSRDVS
eukprot:TRINITY_DN3187_c0_g1_i1.p1 TRINITY_DN3187_c0_g1~~TRINITY_DN3187_c0_g1_i1.p1  ORF type:complete len:179 (+),score=69.44 TRINITY_DN3187_c0_g1_i1:44-580(+)